MTKLTLADVSEKMRSIDFAMMTSNAAGGALASRPMSNNKDVDYQGNSFYFTDESTSVVSDIERDSQVNLAYQGAKTLLGGAATFLSIEGRAVLVRDKALFAKHWHAGLDEWFPEGVDTPGLVLISVQAQTIHWWSGMDSGEYKV